MKKIVSIVSVGLSSVVSPVYALDWSGSAGLATEYTNNSLQAATDQQWDISYISQAGFDLKQRSGTFDATAAYDAAYSTFENNTQSSETALTGEADAHWYLIPSALTWDFRQQNTRQKQQAGVADTTDTRTTQSVFSTGPSSNLQLSPRDLLKLSAQMMNVATSGQVDNGSSRQMLSAAVVHSTSSIQSIGIQTSRQDVSYDASGSVDVVFSQTALEYNRAYRLGRIQASLGKSASKRDGLGTNDGDFYQFYVDFNNVGHEFSVAAMRSLTDSMLGLYSPGFAESSKPVQGASGSNFSADGTALGVIDVVDDKQIDFNYSSVRLCDRCTVSLRVNLTKQDYLVQLLDRRSVGEQAGLGYNFTNRFTGKVTLSQLHEKFLNSDRADEVTSYGLQLDHQMNPQFTIKGVLSSERRNSDEATFDHSVATARIGFLYLFGNSAF